MTQALNYTPKAIADLTDIVAAASAQAPCTAAGVRYLIGKLRQAEIFVLSDSGQLLDRSKPRPEMPGLIVRPPFPVVALEYQANPVDWGDPVFNPCLCPRRIALAWDYTDDLPPVIANMLGQPLSRGVVIASISYYEAHQKWMPIAMAMHVDYEAGWIQQDAASTFRATMLATGQMTPEVAAARTLPGSPIPMSPETIFAAAAAYGSKAAYEMMVADLTDEAAAYMDLCWALACKNVTTRREPAPEKLNRQRALQGKPPLYGFHVLELSGATLGSGSAARGSHSGPRAHLRRGHIRRIAPDRVTWVNQTMVRGRGFVEKAYAL